MAAEYNYIIYIYFLVAILAIQGESVHYEFGKTYKYTYDTKILFNEESGQKESRAQQDVGLRIRLEFDFTPLFEGDGSQLVRLQVSQATLTSMHRGGMEGQLLDMVKLPLYFEYQDGEVGRVWAIEGDSVFCTNIKKGIVSLFQLQATAGERTELDISGECKSMYKISGPTIVKQKLECDNMEIAGLHSNKNEVFGISTRSSSTWTYQLENSVIHSVMGSDRHVAALNIRSSNYPLLDMLLPSAPEVQTCTPNTCTKPQDLVGKVKESLVSEKVGSAESACAFLKMLKAFRNSGKEAISETLTSHDSSYIVSQLLDVGVATQTPGAQRALMELLNFEEQKNLIYPLRYLLATAYTTHPGDYLIKDLLAMLRNRPPSREIKEGMALALGAVIYSYCRVPEQCQNEVVKEYESLILEQYKACSSEECRLLYIRSMGNSGLPQFTDTIFEAIRDKSGSSMMGFTAVQALRRIPGQYIGELEQQVLLKIFHQTERTYDSSVRASAAELLLGQNTSKSTVINILLSAMHDQKQHELSTFILRKIVDLARYDKQLRDILLNLLNDPSINNYNIWAQRGKSSAFSSLLTETADANATYGLYMEMARSGVMKKSAMDVNIVNKDSVQRLLSFGIYASGLESLVGETPDPEEGEEEATAGLGLKILDVLLPPVEFFRGSGGLMSAVWNAPTEPVSALQVTMLLQDHSERFHLGNGLVVELTVLGAVSIDLTGAVSISLWNRNSQSLIRNSGAMVIEGTMKLDSEMGQAGAVFTAEGESYIDFETDVDFYNTPFKMCMQMKRPKTSFKHTFNKFEKATKFDRKYKSTLRRVSHIDGLSYFLSPKNSDECKALLVDK
ncbi:MTP-like protein [Mya arenaria]|uniref:MTP-like protein n=1 Tax=Mya arenaria TaxID=6604 RepID=A0ABY7DFX0_MYAAR|nr:MTP-like protein [Mya arenaria]